MAHLARQIAAVNDVHRRPVLSGGGRSVARLTSRRLHSGVAMIGRRQGDGFFASGMAGHAIAGIAVHLRAIVTIDAVHPPFTEMHVGPEAFVLPQVLIADTAAVTGGAVARHRRCLLKDVPVDETATDSAGLADVAVAAGCVA